MIDISLIITDTEHLFTCLLAICVSLWEDIYSRLMHILNQVVGVLDVDLYELFMYFGY